ncbi:Spc7 kinetochore protein-domain-containing protein [Melampsora americana]|nr:Spc7 kinetochore protein-domain-containing protein [Melampsora americana]
MPNSIPRQSIPSTSTDPNHLSEPPIKVTSKKRSKSLGGALISRRSDHNLTEPIELTPRKKARRSLVPGKSILKSRPTITGLERSNSDNFMNPAQPHVPSLHHSNSMPSVSDTIRSSYPKPLSQDQVGSTTRQDTQPVEEPTQPKNSTNDDDESGSSSDLDLPNQLLSHRASTASNTTTNFRRVSFAAKAYVRTFGSPMAGVPSSSPLPSPSKNSDQSLGPSVEDEGDNTADMSIDDLSGPASLSQPSNLASSAQISSNTASGPSASAGPGHIPPSNKPSRLSMFASFDQPDLDDEDEDMEEADSLIDQPVKLNSTSGPSTQSHKGLNAALLNQDPVPSVDNIFSQNPSQPSHLRMSDQVPRSPLKNPSVPKPSQPTRTTDSSQVPILSASNPHLSKLPPSLQPVASTTTTLPREETSQDMDITSPPRSMRASTTTDMRPSQIPRPNFAGPTELLKRLKSSRLSMAFPEYLREDVDDTEDVTSATATAPLRSLAPPSASSSNPATQLPDQTTRATAASAEGDGQQKSSRLTLAFPEYADDDESMDIEPSQPSTTVDASSKHSHMDEEGNNAGSSDAKKKSSRLTFALPGFDDEEEDASANHDDSPPTPNQPADLEPSRLSDFLSTNDTPMDEDETPNLIDLGDLSVDQPPPNLPATVQDVASNVPRAGDVSANVISSHSVPNSTTSAFTENLGSVSDVAQERIQQSTLPRPVLPLAPLLLERRMSASPSKRAGRVSSPRPRRSMDPSLVENAPVFNKTRLSIMSTPPPDPPAIQAEQLVTNPSQQATVDTSSAAHTPLPSISLKEFFEQAELRFINLAQPRVRQDQPIQPNTEGETASFSGQIYAGMITIPKLRALGTAARTLRSKTESLESMTAEHSRELEINSKRSEVLMRWFELKKDGNQTDGQLASLLNQLRIEKTCAELEAKKGAIEFDLKNREEYRNELAIRRMKLDRDLEMVRKVGEVIAPCMDELRTKKQKLVEEIQKRRAKNEEIEKCDKGLLDALKEETKDLGMAVEVMRGTLAESEFEKTVWKDKVEEMASEKKELLVQIGQWKKKGDGKGLECTTQELVRLKNEFVVLQNMMAWEMVRFDHDRLEFLFWSQIGIVFLLESVDRHKNNELRKVRQIELKWKEKTKPENRSTLSDHDVVRQRIDEFFFNRIDERFRDRSFQYSERVKVCEV